MHAKFCLLSCSVTAGTRDMKKSDPKAGIVFRPVTQVAAGRSATVQVLPSQSPPVAPPTTQPQVSMRRSVLNNE